MSVNPTQKLAEDLLKITKAPMKPQQRLCALRIFIIPALFHSLSLGNIKIGVLVKIDRLIRATVRKWICLPHDTVNAYFHSSVRDGGLGIPALRWISPLLRLQRLRALSLSSAAGLSYPASFLQEEIVRAERRLRDGVEILDSQTNILNRWARLLYASVDGAALKDSRKTPQQHGWVSDGTRFLTGKDFINSCRVRINALPTRSRTSRGRIRDRTCRAGCNAHETLNHVLQLCHRTHAMRVKRHEAIVKYVARNLIASGYEVVFEPHLDTQEGMRKPDIVATMGHTSLVIDAQIVSEQSDLRREHRRKVNYYSQNPDLSDKIKSRFRCSQVQYASCTLSWRGIWSAQSVSQLLDLGAVHKKDLRVISSRVLIGDIACFNLFNMSTVVRRQPRTGIG